MQRESTTASLEAALSRCRGASSSVTLEYSPQTPSYDLLLTKYVIEAVGLEGSV